MGKRMNRRHYSPNHPAVMAWQGRQLPELSVRERRRAVVARARAGKKPRDRVAGLAPLGLVLMVGSGFVFDHAQKVGDDWWLLTGMMLGGGGALLVEAVRQSQGD